MQITSIKENSYAMQLKYVDSYKKQHINFTGVQSHKKISTTPPPPAERIVQFYGASSSIPTSLTLSDIKSLLNCLLNKKTNVNAVMQDAIRNERNKKTMELLRGTPPQKIELTLKRMHDYALAKKISGVIAEEGYGVLTGDATGSMEAAKIGAKENGGYCIGVALKGEKLINKYLDEIYIENTWHKRLDRFNKQAKAPFTIVMPGGEGSINKLWDKIVNNIIESHKDSKKKPPKKIILVDKEYWQPMIDWLKKEPSNRGYIRAFNYDMIKIVDNLEELKSIIKELKSNLFKVTGTKIKL